MRRVSRNETPSGSWDERYRRYQATLASRYLIPTLRSWGIELEGKKLLEAGSGNGGCAAEFHRAGCQVTAVEIDERLVRTARELDAAQGVDVETFVGDICDPRCSGLDRGPFEIVLLRDVVEHLEDLVGALTNLRRHLAGEGVMFVVFPPYYSAYGAHQQILPRSGRIPLNKLPFIHLLPDPWFTAITGGDTPSHGEVARLRGIRLTMKKFRRSVGDAGLAVRNRKHYLIRPTHKLRYGLPVVGASFLAHIPGVDELLVTACYCLLDTKKPGA